MLPTRGFYQRKPRNGNHVTVAGLRSESRPGSKVSESVQAYQSETTPVTWVGSGLAPQALAGDSATSSGVTNLPAYVTVTRWRFCPACDTIRFPESRASGLRLQLLRISPMFIRSKLFVPGSRSELFPKAANSAADAISFDLEDAVSRDRKEDARACVASFLRERGRSLGKITIVRVNAIATPWFAQDVAALACCGVDVFNLPKVESAADIRVAIEAITGAEKAGGNGSKLQILANIETPKGVRLAAEIAAADSCVIGLQVGFADLFLPLGIDRLNVTARQYVRVGVRMAAGEARIPAYDAAFPDIQKPELCREEAEAARSLGFAGKSCIHPTQIAIVNEIFAPREGEVEFARKVLDAAREAADRGTHAFVVDGQLIDAPMIDHARAVTEAAGRYPTAHSGSALKS
jgi:citrate lyase subunit beta / citryl-CoA lyase